MSHTTSVGRSRATVAAVADDPVGVRGRPARHQEGARELVDVRLGQLRCALDARPGDDAVAPVLRDQRARLVQRALVDHERVAAGELAVVVVRRGVRVGRVAEPVDRADEVHEPERDGDSRRRRQRHRARVRRITATRIDELGAVRPARHDGVAIRRRSSPRVAAAHEKRSRAASRAAAPSRRRSSASPSSVSIAARSARDRAEGRAGRSRRPRPRRAARRRRSRRPGGRAPSPRARRRRTPRAATGRRRPPRARSTRRARRRDEAERVGDALDEAGRRRRSLAACPPSPRRTRAMPFSSESRPTKRTCGGSSGSPTSAGIATPLGTTRTSRAPSSRALAASASDGQRTIRARRTSCRAAHRARCGELDVRSPELKDERLSRRDGGQRRGQPVRVHEVGVTRSPSSRARVRGEEEPGRAAPSTGRRLRFPTIPCPYARPKCRNVAGETTSPRRLRRADARPRRARTHRRRRPGFAGTTS